MAAQNNSGGRSWKAQDRYTAFAMIAPAAFLLGMFLLLPFFMAFGLSLTDAPLVPRLQTTVDEETGEAIQYQEPPDFVGTENYQSLLRLEFFTLDPLVPAADEDLVPARAFRVDWPVDEALPEDEDAAAVITASMFSPLTRDDLGLDVPQVRAFTVLDSAEGLDDAALYYLDESDLRRLLEVEVDGTVYSILEGEDYEDVALFTVNDSGALQDESGGILYEPTRDILRPADLEELVRFNLLGTEYLIGAGDAVFYRSLLNIFQFVIIVVPVQTSLALFLAMLVNQNIRGAELYRTIYFSPVVTAMAIVAVLWFFLYNPNQGLINNMLGVLGIGPFDWLEHPASAMIAIIILSIWQGVGFQMVIYLAGLQEIPEELYEASALDGANMWQQFRFVTLPSLRNTTLFVVISTTILAFKLFVQVDVMTFGRGGPEDSTVTTILHMVNEGFRSGQRVGYAAAIAVVFVLIVLVISLLQRRVLTPEEA